MATRSCPEWGRCRAAQRGVCLDPRSHRCGAVACPGAGSVPRGSAPLAVGAGQGFAQAHRAALSPRPAGRAAPPADSCRRRDARGCAVRTGRGAALPRPRLCHRRVGGQSESAQFHRLAPLVAGDGEARRAVVAGAAGCGARSRLGAAALGGEGRAKPAAALECAGTRRSQLACGAVPRAQSPSWRMDFAP